MTLQTITHCSTFYRPFLLPQRYPMAKVLTDKFVEKIKPRIQRWEIPDAGMPGLYLILQPSGVKSWAFRYRFEGASRKHTIGGYPALTLKTARDISRGLHHTIAEGKDPRREQIEAKFKANSARRKVSLFEDVVDKFITEYAEKKNTTFKATKSLLTRHYVSRWKGRRLQDITKDDVLQVLEELANNGRTIGVNRSLAAIRKMFNWAVGQNLIEHSPCDKIQKPFDEVARDRILSDKELILFWKATGRLGYPYGDCFRFLLLTLQRLSEVAKMPWAELAGDMWTIPKDRTKNTRAQDLRLSPFALNILNSVPRIEGCRFVFASSTGTTPISGFSKTKTKLDGIMLDLAREQAIAEGGDPSIVEIPPWRNHDLRRTATTMMAKLGIPPHVCEALLNHKSGTVSGVAAVYNRWEYNDEKSEALRVWNAYVKQLVAGADLSEEGE